jgi:tripartite-type tricarboxylate transporter receptor subunit TctC
LCFDRGDNETGSCCPLIILADVPSGGYAGVSFRRSNEEDMKILPMALAAVFGIAGAAEAQHYPSRPITMIVPYATRGSTDAIGRIIADRMRVSLGQAVVAESVTAPTAASTSAAARAAPDGYTISLGA